MTTAIEVTRDDIERGTPRTMCECPIALAARRAFPGRPVGVSGCLRVGWPGGVLRESVAYRLPPEAVRFIWEFDHGRPGAPFSFEAEIDP